MDVKLKALRVVDLRQILVTANVSVPAKATKTDIIAKIQASKDALDAYAQLYPPDDLLAPPEEVDWNADTAPPPLQLTPHTTTTTTPTVDSPKLPSTKLSASPVPSTTPPTTTLSTSAEDSELEKRKQRAKRFGIPVVEPKQQTPKQQSAEQLQARAKRFGLAANLKRSAQADDIDSEEAQRRKKRAERFGLPVKS